MSQLLNIDLYASTNIGQERRNNEDNFLVADLTSKNFWNAFQPTDKVIKLKLEKELLLAVSDGMGGALAGEVASQLAIDIVREQVIQIQEHIGFNRLPFYEQFRLAIELANKEIIYRAGKDVKCTGMGATFTGLGISQNTAYVAQVGDSRCYLIRNKEIKQISKDQSLVSQLLESGFITEEEVEHYYLRNVILQALGCQPYVSVVVNKFTLKEKDILLLCSDGLTSHIKNHEILSIINNSNNLQEATNVLIKLANERGGYDNITIVLAQITELQNFKNIENTNSNELNIEILERDENLPKDLDLFEPITLENKPLDEMLTEQDDLSNLRVSKTVSKTYSQSQIKDEIEEGIAITSLAIPKITIEEMSQFQIRKETKNIRENKSEDFYQKIWRYLLKIFYPNPQLR